MSIFDDIIEAVSGAFDSGATNAGSDAIDSVPTDQFIDPSTGVAATDAGSTLPGWNTGLVAGSAPAAGGSFGLSGAVNDAYKNSWLQSLFGGQQIFGDSPLPQSALDAQGNPLAAGNTMPSAQDQITNSKISGALSSLSPSAQGSITPSAKNGLNATTVALGALAALGGMLNKPKQPGIPGPSSTAATQGALFNTPLQGKGPNGTLAPVRTPATFPSMTNQDWYTYGNRPALNFYNNNQAGFAGGGSVGGGFSAVPTINDAGSGTASHDSTSSTQGTTSTAGPSNYGTIAGTVGALTSALSGVPGLGLAANAVGTAADLSHANDIAESLGLTGALGLSDALSAMANSASFGLVGNSVAQSLANANDLSTEDISAIANAFATQAETADKGASLADIGLGPAYGLATPSAAMASFGHSTDLGNAISDPGSSGALAGISNTGYNIGLGFSPGFSTSLSQGFDPGVGFGYGAAPAGPAGTPGGPTGFDVGIGTTGQDASEGEADAGPSDGGTSGTDSGGAGSGGGGGGGCYITTAAVDHMGLKDDGPELTTLRDFRDNVMTKTPQGRSMVSEYKEVAPHIVRAIDEMPNANQIYRGLYSGFIAPAVKAAKEGDNKAALDHYGSMVSQLERLFPEKIKAARGGGIRKERSIFDTDDGEHYVRGGTAGQADTRNAKLSDGEFVFDAASVSDLGDGNNEAGARRLEEMRQRIAQHKGRSKVVPPKAKSPLEYLRRAS